MAGEVAGGQQVDRLSVDREAACGEKGSGMAGVPALPTFGGFALARTTLLLEALTLFVVSP